MNPIQYKYSVGLLLMWLLSQVNVLGYVNAGDYPFATDDAIAKDDARIVAWATGYQNVNYGSHIADNWKTPEKALGPAAGSSTDIVCLGRGGDITLTFTQPIRDGDGADFCIFENSFSDTFLELAWVEVSSDGENFVRFPNFSYTAAASQVISADAIYGLASRYKQGKGMPFDLNQIQLAHDALAEDTTLSAVYKTHLAANFQHLDLGAITHIRLVDVVGDGSAEDADGYVIYDPYPTTGSAGFDLDAIGVLNRVEPAGLEQSITFVEIAHQQLSAGSVILQASASSGLSVAFTVAEGPATIVEDVLTFTGTGTVRVSANQSGDAQYAPAEPVMRSFVVADELQYIFFEPVANQIKGTTGVPLHVVSSSGLLVTVQVLSGASDSIVSDASGFELAVGSEVREVVLSATQAGDGDTAPAAEVLMRFQVVEADAVNAPRSFETWQAAYTITGDASNDTDLDGVSDFEEYVAGTNPTDPSSSSAVSVESVDGAFIFTVPVSLRAPATVRVEESLTLSAWADASPELLEIQQTGTESNPLQIFRWRVPMGDAQSHFWQVRFDAQ